MNDKRSIIKGNTEKKYGAEVEGQGSGFAKRKLARFIAKIQENMGLMNDCGGPKEWQRFGGIMMLVSAETTACSAL